jgi:hypothetical protein
VQKRFRNTVTKKKDAITVTCQAPLPKKANLGFILKNDTNIDVERAKIISDDKGNLIVITHPNSQAGLFQKE